MDANENPSLDVATDHFEGGLRMRSRNLDGNLFISNELGSQFNLVGFVEMATAKKKSADIPAILAQNYRKRFALQQLCRRQSL